MRRPPTTPWPSPRGHRRGHWDRAHAWRSGPWSRPLERRLARRRSAP
ncbi:hypothetical protein [Nocardia sp. R6R-6]